LKRVGPSRGRTSGCTGAGAAEASLIISAVAPARLRQALGGWMGLVVGPSIAPRPMEDSDEDRKLGGARRRSNRKSRV
jgi:hypothetical protein